MQNTFDVTGRVVKDAEVVETKNGNKVLTFSVAEDRYYGGQKQDPNFWNCEVWNGQADYFHGLIKKGQLVRVVGSIRQDSFQPKDSDKTVKTYIVAVDDIVGYQGFSAWRSTAETEAAPA
jgi:single-strand DNA-binding protein